MSHQVIKTVPQVYRDCFRLIDHLAGRSRKGDRMRLLVRQQFRAHAGETDEKKVEALKKNAMSGLANYLTMESLGKLETATGATFRDPKRTAEAIRRSLGRDALPEGQEEASAADAAGESSTVVAAAASHGGSPAAGAGASMSEVLEAELEGEEEHVSDAEVSDSPANDPPLPPHLAELQAQLRANKDLAKKIEQEAREGRWNEFLENQAKQQDKS